MRRRRWLNLTSTKAMRAFAIAAFAMMALCASAAAADQAGVTIKMTQEAFVPAQLTVMAGVPITWINNDTVPHSVTAQDGTFDSGPILAGKTFSWTPKHAGDVAYHCIFHPSMTASLTVHK